MLLKKRLQLWQLRDWWGTIRATQLEILFGYVRDARWLPTLGADGAQLNKQAAVHWAKTSQLGFNGMRAAAWIAFCCGAARIWRPESCWMWTFWNNKNGPSVWVCTGFIVTFLLSAPPPKKLLVSPLASSLFYTLFNLCSSRRGKAVWAPFL